MFASQRFLAGGTYITRRDTFLQSIMQLPKPLCSLLRSCAPCHASLTTEIPTFVGAKLTQIIFKYELHSHPSVRTTEALGAICSGEEPQSRLCHGIRASTAGMPGSWYHDPAGLITVLPKDERFVPWSIHSPGMRSKDGEYSLWMGSSKRNGPGQRQNMS